MGVVIVIIIIYTMLIAWTFFGEGKNKQMANFDLGDKVKHKVFGEGTIMEIEEGNSAKLTIAFEKGRKVIMSSYLKLLK